MSDKTLLPVGSFVLVEYKTGQYIGELIEWAPPRGLVQIASVVKHPEQGDLHNPMETEVAMFHQRRALSYREKTWIPAQSIHPYRGAVPKYSESLRQAIEAEIRLLQRTQKWAERSLVELVTLQSEYFPK
ncbi:MAG: kinase [Paenibacillus sp.]|jgi:kinase-associated protein B|nr:kinase [Paenibacillus sp.]